MSTPIFLIADSRAEAEDAYVALPLMTFPSVLKIVSAYRLLLAWFVAWIIRSSSADEVVPIMIRLSVDSVAIHSFLNFVSAAPFVQVRPFDFSQSVKYAAQVYSGNLLLQSILFLPLSTPNVPLISAMGARSLVYIYSLSPVPLSPVVQSYLKVIHGVSG